MNFRYGFVERESKRFFRKFFPIPKSPWTAGPVKDVCEVELVPRETLKTFFVECINKLKKIKGNGIGTTLNSEYSTALQCPVCVLQCGMCSAVREVGLTQTRLFGFDAFEGLPKDAENEDGGVWKKGFYSCSFEKMKECLNVKTSIRMISLE
ncbi:hypothetical protein AUJ65_01515 [Candidatus Micrarchaeota archaeon CG1_02_51_15]|nr:MAG: hypothetical protein AUJ65_01515 [Candidatus Micrarchaeota archaeon CG1_02_51_15]